MRDLTELLPHIKLKFNLDYPSIEECYLFGYECALANIDESENPFRTASVEAEQWMEGWWAGFYGEEPIFTWDQLAHEQVLEKAQNDHQYVDIRESYLTRVLEIAGVIAISAILGYQVLDLVA